MNRNCDTSLVKIKSYVVRRAGARGLVISLPAVWIDDLGLAQGDRLDIYRDTEDRLIIVAAPKDATPAGLRGQGGRSVP